MNPRISAIALLALAAVTFAQTLPSPPPAPPAKSPAPPATTSPAATAPASTSPATAPAVQKKLPAPDIAALKTALKLVDDIYKDELAKAKTPDQKQTLATTMLATAAEEKKPASRYALLITAMDLAAASGDLDLAAVAVDRLDRSFDIDSLLLKTDAVATAARTVKTAQDCRKLLLFAGPLIDAAISADRFDIAKTLCEADISAAAASKDGPSQKDAAARNQDLHDAEVASVAAKKALTVLASHPADPEANLTVGKYRCFTKTDWPAGLPMLARVADEAIKSLAISEIAGAKTPDDQIKLADGWWTLAEKFTATTQRHIQLHAASWYHTALPALTGLEKLRVQKRLDAFEAETASALPMLHKTIDLLALVDPAKDSVAGTWLVKEKTLRADDTGNSRIEFPYHPPAEYDFHIEFSRDQGDDSVNMVLAASDKHFMWTMGGWKNTILGFDEIAHVRANQNPKSITAKSVLDNGKHYDALVKVRKTGVEASVNGKVVGQWKTNYADMGIPDNWNLRDPATLGLATNKSPTSFYKIEVTEVTGTGTLTRK